MSGVDQSELQAALGGGGGEKQAEMDSRREMILGSVLSAEAKERLSRIAIVKPDKAQQIGDQIISMAQRGQISEKLSEDRLKSMLASLENSKTTQIKFQRRTYGDDDDEEDYSNL